MKVLPALREHDALGDLESLQLFTDFQWHLVKQEIGLEPGLVPLPLTSHLCSSVSSTDKTAAS